MAHIKDNFKVMTEKPLTYQKISWQGFCCRTKSRCSLRCVTLHPAQAKRSELLRSPTGIIFKKNKTVKHS